MSFVSASISGGTLRKAPIAQQGKSKLFTVQAGDGAPNDAYIHLTEKEAAQWAVVLNEFAEEAE